MVQKRPLGEELYEVSAKQPKHLESSDERVSVLEFPGYNKSKPESDEMLDGGNLTELQSCNENEINTSLPGSVSNSSGITSTTSEEDVKSEAPFCILLSPDHYNLDLPVRTIVRSGEIYSYLLEHSPRKLVPIGRDFQAEVPEWGGLSETVPSSSTIDASEVLNIMPQSLKSKTSDHSADGDKFAGSCLIPMPELILCADAVDMIGGGRICCSCEDMGSISCVRQHIREARENLKKTLGEETFAKLGFYDMGEVVAEKWSEAEEEIFEEVVSWNPASLGRNFWNRLAIEFPTRTKKEIVSYYFNVFMFRKRAEQNRDDMLDVDSDKDEWVESNVSTGLIHKINASDDSVGESPVLEDDFGHDEMYGNNLYKYNEDITSETSEDDKHENFDGNKRITSLSEIFPNEEFKNCSSVPAHQPLGQVISDELRKHDVKDGPCMSDNIGIAPDVVARDKAHDIRHWNSNISSLSSSSGHEYLLEPCSSKEWDVGYLTCSKDEDFLPTCSVIEEVFGAGACNYKTRDG